MSKHLGGISTGPLNDEEAQTQKTRLNMKVSSIMDCIQCYTG